MTPILATALTCALTSVLIVVLRPLAMSVGLVDVPDARKTHTGPIPLIGGLAIFVAVVLTSDEPLLRHVAASSPTEPDPKVRAARLAPLLSDPVKAVRLDAVSALAGTRDDLLKPYQRDALRDGIEEYRRAMAYSLDFSSSGLNLGNLYANLRDPATAERYYRLALGIDDLFFPAKMNLAVLLSGAGRNTEAETLLREVVTAYPENDDAAYSLGLLLVELGKPQEAVDWLARAGSSRMTELTGIGWLETSTPSSNTRR